MSSDVFEVIHVKWCMWSEVWKFLHGKWCSVVFRISKRRGEFRWPLLLTQKGPKPCFPIFPMVKNGPPKYATEVMYEKWWIWSDVWKVMHVNCSMKSDAYAKWSMKSYACKVMYETRYMRNEFVFSVPCETQSVIIPWFPVICHRRMTSRAAERTGWNCRCSLDVRHRHIGRRAAGSGTSALAWPSWPRRWPDRRRLWRTYWGSDGIQRWRRSRERFVRPVDSSEGSNSNLQHWIQTNETNCVPLSAPSSGGATVHASKIFSIFCFSRPANIYIRFTCKQTVNK